VAEFGRVSRRIVALAAVVALSSTPVIGDSACAQTSGDNVAASINLGASAGFAAEAAARAAPRQDGTTSPFDFTARAGFASDCIYRSVTLSDRKPA
jgi:hypothetical protein